MISEDTKYGKHPLLFSPQSLVFPSPDTKGEV